jgi:hypothetical protein
MGEMMDKENQYIVGSMFSSHESANELAKRKAKKDGKVYFVGVVVGEFHPEAEVEECKEGLLNER